MCWFVADSNPPPAPALFVLCDQASLTSGTSLPWAGQSWKETLGRHFFRAPTELRRILPGHLAQAEGPGDASEISGQGLPPADAFTALPYDLWLRLLGTQHPAQAPLSPLLTDFVSHKAYCQASPQFPRAKAAFESHPLRLLHPHYHLRAQGWRNLFLHSHSWSLLSVNPNLLPGLFTPLVISFCKLQLLN